MPPEQAQQFRERVRLIQRVQELKQRKFTWKEVMSTIKSEPWFENAAPISLRRIQQLLKRYEADGEVSLVPRSKLSGNRTKRHDQEFEEIVLDVLEEYFIRNDRMTVEMIHRISADRYKKTCTSREIEEGPHGRKVVDSIIRSLPYEFLMKSRLGRTRAKNPTRQAIFHHKVSLPFDRVEIDSTWADVHIRSEVGTLIGRCHICAAIDCATGVVLGMVLSLSAPSQELTINTIKQILRPRDEQFFTKHSIVHKFDCPGTPKVIVSDNGSENTGDLITSLLKRVDSDWVKTPYQSPEKKPYIERFLGRLNSFLQTLPGGIKSSIRGIGDRSDVAIDEGYLTFGQLENAAYRWLYDVYSRTPRRRVETPLLVHEAPIDCFKRLRWQHILPPPPGPTEFFSLFFVEGSTRKVFHYGIEFRRIQYHGANLSRLLSKIGPGAEVRILYDPFDIRSIAFLDPTTQEYVPIHSKATLPAVSFSLVDKIQTKVKGEPVDPEEIYKSIANLSPSEHKGGKTARNKKSEVARIKMEKVRTQSAVPPTIVVQTKSNTLAPSGSARRKISRPTQVPSVKRFQGNEEIL